MASVFYSWPQGPKLTLVKHKMQTKIILTLLGNKTCYKANSKKDTLTDVSEKNMQNIQTLNEKYLVKTMWFHVFVIKTY